LLRFVHACIIALSRRSFTPARDDWERSPVSTAFSQP
jgi:hypothetical protein